MSELEDAVIDGKRPEIPVHCPGAWSALMQACWSTDPEARPSFNRVLWKLFSMRGEIAPNLVVEEPARCEKGPDTVKMKVSPVKEEETIVLT